MTDISSTLLNGHASEEHNEPQLITPARATLMSSNGYRTPEELRRIPTPDPTRSHKPIPHYEFNDTLDEHLGYRKIGVTKTQIAVSKDGMECYLIKHLDTGFPGGHFTLGGRNSNNKKFALGLTLGYNIGVCDNGMFYGDFMAATRKHTKNTNLRDILSIGLDEAQRYCEPLRKDIDRWRETQLSENDAKLRLYGIFIEDHIDLPKHLGRPAHETYFNSKFEEFPPGTEWSFQNALTNVIQVLDPVRQQQAQAAIGQYFKTYGR